MIRLTTTQLWVHDQDEALEFYTKRLGLMVRSDRPDFGFAGAWLDAGAQQAHGRAEEAFFAGITESTVTFLPSTVPFTVTVSAAYLSKSASCPITL